MAKFKTFENNKNRDLGEAALLINECQHVQRFACQNIQSALVVLVVDVLPNNVLTGVLLLLKLEHVFDKELLQLLVRKVNAQLLKAVGANNK